MLDMNIVKFISDIQISEIIALSADGKRNELTAYIDTLTDRVKAELAILAWKGRGDDIKDEEYELSYALDEVKDQNFASYLAGKPLHKYLG